MIDHGHLCDCPQCDGSAYDFDAPDECYHEDYEVDSEGRAQCDCGYSWWLTSEQFEAHLKAQAEWEAAYDEEMRRQHSWWGRFQRWFANLSPFRTHGRRVANDVYPLDDEIPF